MKKLLIACTLLPFILGSCKKETQIPLSENIESSRKGQDNILSNLVEYKATKEEIRKGDEEFIRKYRERSKMSYDRPGQCPFLSDHSSTIIFAQREFACSNTSIVRFRIRMVVIPSLVYVSSYSFTLAPQPGVNYIGYNTTFISDIEDCSINNGNPQYGDCARVITYEAEFLVNNTIYYATQIGEMKVTAICQQAGSTPQLVTGPAMFDFPQSHYLNNPAEITVVTINPPIQPTPSIRITTPCDAAGCFPMNPHILCASSGVFKQRPLGSSDPYTNHTIFPLTGTVIEGFASGTTYEYIATLSYSFGASLPKVGTFTFP